MSDFRRAAAAAVLLAAFTLAVFWPVREHDFVNFDDPDYVTHNPQVKKGLTLDGVVWAFTRYHSHNWHPITWLSHMTDVELFGMNPGAHHLVNAFLHAANTALLCLVLWRMTGKLGRSAFVAALFALHPLHVESVAWIAERKDVLGAFFWLLTMGAYRRWTRSRRRADFLWTLLLFAFGLMSKPMVVTLPFVLVLLDVWPLKRLAIERLTGTQPENTNEPRTSLKAFLRQWTHVLAPFVKEKTPFFALSAASCVVTFAVQRAGGAVVSLEHIPLDLRIENAFVSYVRYLAKTFWPADLSVYYQYPDDWPLWPVAGAVLLLLGVTALVLRQARARPWLAVGWLWYLGTLVPVIGLVQVGEQAMANRYTYLPLVGIFVMVAWTAAEWAASLRRREIFLCGAASLTLLACVWTTRAQLRHWSSGRDLFQEALRITPGDMVHINLGNALSKEGKLADAVAEYEAALRINPRHPAAHYNLGLTWAKLGRWADAAAAYTEALRYKPDFMDARNNLGVALAAQRKFDEARACYAEALRLRPGDAGALNNLGNALCAMGRLEESLDCYAQAVKSKHDYAKAQLNWGMALADLGRPAEALPHFQEAARLDPESAEAHNELARALAERGDLAPALEHYAAALKLKPDFAEAHVNLGLALLLAGKLDDARAAFTRALQLRPDYPNAHNNLAYVFAQQGRAREAVLHFSEAIRLQPDTAPALNSLAWIYATHADAQLRNGAEAVRLAERACALTKRQQPVFLGTLAAAYAEAGRFDDAVRTAREAQELATRQGLSEVAAQLSARVKSFEAGQPWRQATP